MNNTGAFRLLPGLRFTPHVQSNERWYAVEDPQSGRFLKLGYIEYLVVSCLQNGLEPAEITQLLAKHELEPEEAQEHVAATVTWLVRHGLLVANGAAAPPAASPIVSAEMAGPSSPAPAAAAAAAPKPSGPKGLAAFDPFFIRIPLLSGSLTEYLARPLSILFSRWAVYALAALVAFALLCFLSGTDRFLSLSHRLFVEDGRLWWIVAWLILKAVHELGHAVAAICVGSRIRSSGLHLIYLGPVPYIDVTDLWTISTRRHRILVSGCGMLFELAVAAMAVITISFTNIPSLQYFCAALATLGTVTTFAFNANPLMRFDGYYIVSDWLARPNLWSEAQTSARGLFSRILNPFAEREGGLNWGLVLYGVSCMIYRVVMMVTLAWWLFAVWDGVGVLIICWGAYCWFFRPWNARRTAASKAPAAAPRTAGAVLAPQAADASSAPLTPLTGCDLEEHAAAAVAALAFRAQAAQLEAARLDAAQIETERIELGPVGAARVDPKSCEGSVPESPGPEITGRADSLFQSPSDLLKQLPSSTSSAGVARSASAAPRSPVSSKWWRSGFAKAAYLGGLTVFLFSVAMMPSPWGLRAPGVIAYANPTEIRSVADGFLAQLPIADRQMVRKGDLLAQLENHQLTNDVEQIRLKLEISLEQVSGLRARGELALLQAEQAKAESLAEQYAQLRTRAESLAVYAPCDGMVVLAAAEKILGRYVQPGHPLCMLVDPANLEIRALASQRDAATFMQSTGESLGVRGTTGRSDIAKLVSVDRRGSDICPEPSLAANYGGPLTVEVGVDRQGAPELKFSETRFEIIAELDGQAAQRWVPGQLASLSLSGKPQRVWEATWEATVQFLKTRATGS